MAEKKLLLGYHVHSSAFGKACEGLADERGLAAPLEEAKKHIESYGFDPCAQIFVYGPQNYHEAHLGFDATTRPIDRLIVHSAYISPLWTANKSARGLVAHQLKICADIGADFVTHFSESFAATYAGAMETLAAVDAQIAHSITIFIEINSSKRPGFASSPQINAVLDKLAGESFKMLRFGVCIDTAHAFACGLSLADGDETRAFLRDIHHPCMFHLNDSYESLGSGTDQHAPLLDGNIWGKYRVMPVKNSGLVAILDFARENGCPIILERKLELVSADLELIRSLGY